MIINLYAITLSRRLGSEFHDQAK